jgi:hypothetical protein
MSFIDSNHITLEWKNTQNIENNASYPICPSAPTPATNKRFKHHIQMIAEEPIELSPPSSPSSSFTETPFINVTEKRSYTTPYFKQPDLITPIPTPAPTPELQRPYRHENLDDNQIEQVILKRHSTLSSVHTTEGDAFPEVTKTLSGSPSTVSLGRHHTTGHTLKSARQRMADKERLNLMRRSEEFQKELSARRKAFKRLSRMAKEDPDDDRVMMGTRISEGHQNYVLMYNMLTGIRIAVSRVTAKIDRPLTDEDYSAAHKLAFDVIGDEMTPGAKYDFKFKDYAPWVFRNLREKFGVDPADYLVIFFFFFFLVN